VDEAESGGDGVQARPVYVAAVDLACKCSPFSVRPPIMEFPPVAVMGSYLTCEFWIIYDQRRKPN